MWLFQRHIQPDFVIKLILYVKKITIKEENASKIWLLLTKFVKKYIIIRNFIHF